MVVRSASGTLGGVPMKHISLVTLIFQNSALILVRPPSTATYTNAVEERNEHAEKLEEEADSASG